MYVAVILGALFAIGYSYKFLHSLWNSTYLFYSFINTAKFNDNYDSFLPFTAQDKVLDKVYGFGTLNKAGVKRYKTQKDVIRHKCTHYAFGLLLPKLIGLAIIFGVLWVLSETSILYGIATFIFVCTVYVIYFRNTFTMDLWPRFNSASAIMFYLKGKDLVKPKKTKSLEPESLQQDEPVHSVKQSFWWATGINFAVIVIAVIALSTMDSAPISITDYLLIFFSIFAFFEAIIIIVVVAYVLANKAERAVMAYFKNRKK